MIAKSFPSIPKEVKLALVSVSLSFEANKGLIIESPYSILKDILFETVEKSFIVIRLLALEFVLVSGRVSFENLFL